MILETAARINQNGNLSLGQSGADDGAGDATHGYAKSDCVLILPHASLPLAVPTTNLTESVTRTSAGIYQRLYTAGGNVASYILIEPQLIFRTAIGQTTPPFGNVAPHGFKLTSMDMNYTVATLAPTSIVVTAQTETVQANATARSNSSTTPLGAVTYQNPVGTVVSTLPVTVQSTPYVTRTVFGTPAFVTSPLTPLNIEIALVQTNTSVVAITYLALNFSYALY